MNEATLPQPGYLAQGKRYLTFRQAAQEYPAFSVVALRWLRVNGATTGFDRCVISIGHKVVLDTLAFEEWLDQQRASRKEAA